MAVERVDSMLGGRINLHRRLKPGYSTVTNNFFNDSGSELIHSRKRIQVLSNEAVEVTENVVQLVVDGKPVYEAGDYNYPYTTIMRGETINVDSTSCLGWMLGWVTHYRFTPDSP